MPRVNTTGKGWRGQGFDFGRKPHGHYRGGRVLVSNGQSRNGGDLICCATGTLHVREDESVEDIIRRDGKISIMY